MPRGAPESSSTRVESEHLQGTCREAVLSQRHVHKASGAGISPGFWLSLPTMATMESCPEAPGPRKVLSLAMAPGGPCRRLLSVVEADGYREVIPSLGGSVPGYRGDMLRV